jgi:hypothetical protein
MANPARPATELRLRHKPPVAARCEFAEHAWQCVSLQHDGQLAAWLKHPQRPGELSLHRFDFAWSAIWSIGLPWRGATVTSQDSPTLAFACNSVAYKGTRMHVGFDVAHGWPRTLYSVGIARESSMHAGMQCSNACMHACAQRSIETVASTQTVVTHAWIAWLDNDLNAREVRCSSRHRHSLMHACQSTHTCPTGALHERRRGVVLEVVATHQTLTERQHAWRLLTRPQRPKPEATMQPVSTYDARSRSELCCGQHARTGQACRRTGQPGQGRAMLGNVRVCRRGPRPISLNMHDQTQMWTVTRYAYDQDSCAARPVGEPLDRSRRAPLSTALHWGVLHLF